MSATVVFIFSISTRPLQCESSVRFKARSSSRRIRAKSLFDALAIPAVPAIKPGTFSAKLQKRLDSSNTTEPNSNESDDLQGLTGIVTGWGKDELAPRRADHEKPSHDSKVDLKTVRQFEKEAFYRHGRDSPHFERRLQLWVTGNAEEPTLKKIESEEPQPAPAQLSHSLERVLFNEGPHWLRDPRTCVNNFDQWLENIPDIHDFDYGRLTPYVTSSRDSALLSLAKREGKTFAGSTSSLTSLLSHIYFVFSGGRGVDTSVLSSAFANESRDFSYGARWPGGIILQHKDGRYCIDSQGIDEPEKHLLLNMGTMLEKFLTYSESDFGLLLRDTPVTEELAKLQRPEAYQYSTSDKFVMRSQLDAYDSRLPGSGVFDIKTRAVVAIRYDPLNYKNNSGYLIKTVQGAFESFEREQYDLFRAAFLKYVFQARIGGMDGIFVAYHNTAQMFGFQYFSTEDMDERLFGGSLQGDRVFHKCVKCMEEILSEVALCFPGVSVNCDFETSVGENVLRIYVEPTEWDGPGDAPIVELLVTATNFMNGERVLGPMNYGKNEDDWSILLNITRSSTSSEALQSSIRKQRDSLIERKHEFAFSIPQGVSPDQMAREWLTMDYTSGAKSNANGKESNEIAENVSSDEAERLERLSRRFKGRLQPSEFVKSLRKLASEGKRYLDELNLASEQGSEEGVQDSRSSSEAVSSQETMNIASPHPAKGFSRDTDTTPTLDNSPSISVHSHSGSEGGPLEQVDIDVPVEETSVHAKLWEEDRLIGERGREEYRISTEVGLGENPVENDNQVPPSVEGAIGKTDHSETLDVLGSEEDQLKMLDPINVGDIDTSDQSQPSGKGPEDEIEILEDDDQAWTTCRPTKDDMREPNHTRSDDQPKAPTTLGEV